MAFFLLTRPGLPPPNGDLRLKSMCFWESSLTTKEGIHHLLPNPDMSLLDQDPGVVNGLGKSELENLGLQTTLQEILNLQAKDEIKLHLSFIKDSNPDQPSEEGIFLEQSFRVFLLQGEEVPSGGPDLSQGVLDPPDFPLVPQAIFSEQLQLLVQIGLFEGPPWSGVHLGVHHGHSSIYHLGCLLRDFRGSLVEVNQANISLV